MCQKLEERKELRKNSKLPLICAKSGRQIKSGCISFWKCWDCFPQSSPVVWYTLLYGVWQGSVFFSILFLLTGLSFLQACAGDQFCTSFPELTVHTPLHLAFSEHQADSLKSIRLKVFIPWKTASTSHEGFASPRKPIVKHCLCTTALWQSSKALCLGENQ